MTIDQALDLAAQHHQSGRLAEAEAIYRQVLAAQPQNARAIMLMGVMFHHRGNSPTAIELIRQAIQLEPLNADFYSNLGVILTEAGLSSQAVDAYQQAIRINSADPEYHWNLAVNLLTDGNFESGWEEFEWRLRSPGRQLNRGFPQPQWNGEDLTGKTILLHAEGGFGDALQFIRYVPMVLHRGGRIVLECQPELIRLFSPIAGISQIIPRSAPLPPFDFQIPLQGLPRVFETRLENIPGSVPYLTAPQPIVDYWKTRLASEPGPKVGLVWAGSNTTGGRRTQSLEIFAPLAGVSGVRFYTLQKGPFARQPIPPGLSLIDYTDQLNDFADMSGFITNLDLVISIDTSIPHLVGALARPVWTVIGFVPDFRWLRDRNDSPWYPTMRLFRQASNEPWTAVTTRVARELVSCVENGAHF